MSVHYQQRIRVKICGITRVDDAVEAARLGADAIGLNFYAPSPRAVTIEQAHAIAAALPPFVARVGLFVNASAAYVEQVLHRVGLDLLQFHGEESRDACEQHGRPYIKSVSVRAETEIAHAFGAYSSASAILLDTWHKDVRGGSGETFDWSLVPQVLPLPVILAGGLTAANVSSAIASIQPYAVDVSGGVEVAKGKKDAELMAAFIHAVREASATADVER